MLIGRYVCQIGRPLVGACVKTLARWPTGPRVTHVTHVTNMAATKAVVPYLTTFPLLFQRAFPVSAKFRSRRFGLAEARLLVCGTRFPSILNP
jgi:hypothetical protein